jgi:hypothetical protein
MVIRADLPAPAESLRPSPQGRPITEWDELVDLQRRTVSPRAFTDPEVYQAEQERIFARCWLYVAHESQIPRPQVLYVDGGMMLGL